MQCFIDYIGIKYTGANEPASGLYINQLPGITLKMIDSIVEAEQQTFLGLWKEVQDRTLRKFSKDYKGKFENKYVGFCCNSEECNPENICCENKSLFADSWMYCLGTELMIERMYSSRLNKFTTIDKDQAQDLKDYYQVEYEKSLNHAIKHIPKEFIDRCFECRSNIDHVEVLP